MQTPMMDATSFSFMHIMMTWFALHVNIVVSHLACTSCACMHGAYALYLSGLACMQADLNLEKITASHFQGTKYPQYK